jgi:hypothetical protein
MPDISPAHATDGCSNLAKTSRERNKTIRKTLVGEDSYQRRTSGP